MRYENSRSGHIFTIWAALRCSDTTYLSIKDQIYEGLRFTTQNLVNRKKIAKALSRNCAHLCNAAA